MVKNFLRRTINSGYFQLFFDVSRYLYNKKNYGKEYRNFLNAIKYNEEADVKSIYDRLTLLGNKALRDMYYITFPYSFVENYIGKDANPVQAYVDEEGWAYVLHNGKRLYGQKSWNKGVIARYYTGLMIEQDKEAAHCYFPKGGYNCSNEVVADLGAAEGIFGLDVIDKVKKLYLFECDNTWIEPLQRTFAPWKDKVEIVKKYVSDKTSDGTVSLDDFFSDKDLDFIKADIEGAEIQMLKGGNETMRKVSHAVICLYHNKNDESIIVSALKGMGFSTCVNPGYMVFFEGDNPNEWLRHGVVSATKE